MQNIITSIIPAAEKSAAFLGFVINDYNHLHVHGYGACTYGN